MPGWIVQTYEIVPAFVGVYEKLWPLPKVWDLIGPPVTLCGALSSLTQVTFWPTLTVVSLGANWMFCILIVTAPPLELPPPLAGAAVAVFAGVELLLESSPPQPATRSA